MRTSHAVMAIMLAGLVGCATAPSVPERPLTATETYLTTADYMVQREIAIMDLGAAIGGTAPERQGRSEGRPNDMGKLRGMLDDAQASLADNAVAREQLREHWVKLTQCLTAGNSYTDLGQCKYELAEWRARVEAEIPPAP